MKKLRQDLVIQISAACLMLSSFAGLSAGGNDNLSQNTSQSFQLGSELLSTELFVAAAPIESSGNAPEPKPVNIRNGSFKAV
jgi:hypothetical protein